ncbi:MULTISPECIES: transketolase [Prauserella salsuginis group]|uniref:Transketolase n=2 Tax=Prauserella salsuginis group TaxID=2893672 RepID=A0A839XRI9_9PSEU|nr:MULTISPECIES: transketolase [Prauserella salsuginis group]MBB3665810.1 transketolase [Prauserella sediminis]MCR3722989.1 transketolase [Prauserella flava]MCR3737335.1 transketolase [Prauserella salsuginis]
MSENASTAENNPLLRRNYPADWADVDTRAVDTVRVLAADAVEHCGSGHPGTAMSLAPVAYSLFQRTMRHDPADPEWPARDRFVLSAGHSSLTLYIQLFLAGYGLEMADLEQLRKWESRTPGHPEYRHTPGVETTTGPLGQGLANAVGMAMAARRERGLLDPESPAGESPFDHHVYVIASDGDIEEGVTSEASSIAGRQELGNLVVIYDDNKISIEDDTNVALSEDTAKRYEAYGWHVQVVDGGEDVVAFENAIAAAKAESNKPSFILLRTVIGYPAPTKMDTGKAHGAALGADEVASVKKALDFDPDRSFVIEDEVLDHTRKALERGKTERAQWQERFDAWATQNPERKKLADRLRTRSLPEGWAEQLPTWEPDEKGVATRKASGQVLNAVADVLPELWGGSADLAESNNTIINGSDSFGPESASTDMFTMNPYGRNLHFGVREHAMGSILNGIALHGGTRPYGATFLIFSDYMRPAVRLAALMKAPVTYVWTHDSIGLGEDGPTHQPIEQLASLRAIPGLSVVRPADANETAAAWKAALEDTQHPTGLALTRQNVPVLEGTNAGGVAKGGYVLAEASNGNPEVVLIATGSEVQLAVEARAALEADGVAASVVSMPCVEWFDRQDQAYRDAVIPPTVKARVAVEAGIAQPWHRFVGDGGEIVSIEHFGASADYKTLFREFGFTAEAVVAAARRALDKNS